jgi:cation transport regulator ChaC
MTSDRSWYFAYGSNMSAARMLERLSPEGVAMGRRVGGRLDGWTLTFDKVARRPEGSGTGNIVPAAGGLVYGTLNELPAAGFDVLDRFEGVAAGHYERRHVPVRRADTGETVEAITYVALRVGPGLKPTRAYLAHLLAGRDLLPAGYWEELSRTPTFD